MHLHSLVGRPFRSSYFAPGQQTMVYKSNELPLQILNGFRLTTAGFRLCHLTINLCDHSHWSPDFCTRNAPFIGILRPPARPSTPYLPWRTREPIPSPAGSIAHIHALMLQLSLGKFFFFALILKYHYRYYGSIYKSAARTAWGTAVAIARSKNHTFIPSVYSDPLLLTGNTFAVGADYGDGQTFPTAPTPYTWGPATTTGHWDHHDVPPFVNSNPSQLIDNTLTAGAAYDDGLTFPTAPDPHGRGRATATGHWDHLDVAPLANSNPPQFAESTFIADAAYNNSTAFPTAPTPYALSPAVATGPTHPHLGAGYQYPDPLFRITDPFTTTNNSNSYHSHLPANGFNNQLGAAIDSPMLHAAANPFAFPGEIGEAAPRRPTCTTCNRSFGRQGDLIRHAKKHLAGPKAFPCAVAGCPYANDRKDKLRDHYRRRHPGVAVSFTQS